MMDNQSYKSGISSQALKPLAAVMYVVGSRVKNDDMMRKVGSTILNRLDSLDPEFGAENGRISEVINLGYRESKDPLYEEFFVGNFSNKKQERIAKKALLISSGLVRGTVPRETDQFFFSEEISEQKSKITKEEVKIIKSNKNSGNKPGKSVSVNKVGKIAGKR